MLLWRIGLCAVSAEARCLENKGHLARRFHECIVHALLRPAPLTKHISASCFGTRWAEENRKVNLNDMPKKPKNALLLQSAALRMPGPPCLLLLLKCAPFIQKPNFGMGRHCQRLPGIKFNGELPLGSFHMWSFLK